MNALEVKNYREIAGLTQQQFADKLSVSLRAVQSWESGARNVSQSTAFQIETLFGSTHIVNEAQVEYNGSHVLDSRVMHVPLVQKYAYGGYLSGFGDVEYLEDLPTYPFIVEDKTFKGKYMAFEVRGDSMDDGTINSYPQGTVVLCREVQRTHWQSKLHHNAWKAFVIVHRESGILIKQITQHDTAKGVLTLSSLNPQFEDVEIRLDDCLQIFNVIKKVMD